MSKYCKYKLCIHKYIMYINYRYKHNAFMNVLSWFLFELELKGARVKIYYYEGENARLMNS